MKVFLIAGFLSLSFATQMNAQYKYPETRKDKQTDNYFGTNVDDPYRWLENDNSQETKDWVTQQNKVTFGFLDKIPYRKQWFNELEALNNYPKYSSPFRKNEY